MDNQSCFEKFADNQARLDHVVYLAGALAADTFPRCIEEDFLFECEDKEIAKMFGPIPDDVRQALEDEDYPFFWEWVYENNAFGFLIKISTPEFKFSKTGKSARFSWGCYQYQWFYADTLDDAIAAGFKWVKKVRKKEKAKAMSA